MSSTSGSWSLYPYEPNQAAPVVFAVLLTLLGGIQVYQSFLRYKWKKFGATMIWATTVWVAGFIARSISVRRVQDIGLFIAQYVLVLMGPPLYSAAEYFILGRLLAYLPYHTPIHPGRVFSTFIFLSFVVETLTGSGAANSAGADRSPAQRETGRALLNAALILQCFVEVAFISLVAILELRARRGGQFPRRVRTVCYILYITSLMILTRCIVRTIEGFECASSNEDTYCRGPISSNETYLWVFEISNITLCVLVLALFHPGRFLPRSSKIYLDPGDGETERMGPGFAKADTRPFWVTCVDPFNLYGSLSGRGMGLEKFWEGQWPVREGQSRGDDERGVGVVEERKG